MKRIGKILTVSAAAALGYKLIKSSGLADRIMYNKEYEAAKRYINSHYTGSRFTNLEKTDSGFVCVITTPENKKIALTMAEASKGVYVFAENTL